MSTRADVEVVRVGPDHRDAIVDVLVEAFGRYPVVRHVLGEDCGEDRVRRLVGFFVAARFLQGEPAFGARVGSGLGGAALVSFNVRRAEPAALEAEREAAWKALGDGARARYEACGAVWSRALPPGRCVHLNMLGVRTELRGRGVARALLDAVHELAGEVPGCTGVSLTTEDPDNVPLYEHVGYDVVGRSEIAPGLETWVMARPTGRR